MPNPPNKLTPEMALDFVNRYGEDPRNTVYGVDYSHDAQAYERAGTDMNAEGMEHFYGSDGMRRSPPPANAPVYNAWRATQESGKLPPTAPPVNAQQDQSEVMTDFPDLGFIAFTEDVDALVANPSKENAAIFDENYGAGSAVKLLQKKSAQPPAMALRPHRAPIQGGVSVPPSALATPHQTPHK